jgi:ABC-type transport system involved in multi-copper enzyme maturation permease subunit
VRWLRETWRGLAGRERGALAVLAGALTYLVLFGRTVGPVGNIVLRVLALCSLLVVTRRSWTGLFGPVFLHDAIRSARRANLAALRAGYGGVLLLVLFIFYAVVIGNGTYDVWTTLWQPGKISPAEMARFGASFFQLFGIAQLTAIMLITPVCAAGAISEEKERRTLEFLLITSLHDREIALGKLASRISFIILFVLTGLPVAVVLQFLGGIDPNRVLAVFAISGCTILSMSGLSLACSVAVRSTRLAIFLSYAWAGVFLLVTLSCVALPPMYVHNFGNPILAVFALFSDDVPPMIWRFDTLTVIMVNYVSVHLAVGIGCCSWAVLNLRALSVPGGQRETMMPAQAVTQAAWKQVMKSERLGRSVPVPRVVLPPPIEVPPRKLPAIGGYPMIWKELYAEPLARLGAAGQGFAVAAVILFLLVGGWLVFVGFTLSAAGGWLGSFSNSLVRYGGTGVCCFFFLIVAQRAAGSIVSERYRQTLEALLATDLTGREILFAKWLASILCVRKVWLALGLAWVLALCTGGISIASFVLLPIAWSSLAAFVALIGMWLSLTCKTGLRASILTVVTLLLVSTVFKTIWWLEAYALFPAGIPSALEWISNLMRYGLNPPIALSLLAFRGADFEAAGTDRMTPAMVGYAMIGVAIYGLTALGLWRQLQRQFAKVTGRAG